MKTSREAILADIRQSLKRGPQSPVAPRPAIIPPRVTGEVDVEVEKLIEAIAAVKGQARRIEPGEIPSALADLVRDEKIQKATLWNTGRLAQHDIAGRLRALGVEIIPASADKRVMAEADLGVTEADYALPETGTLGLLSSPEKPRSVSLLPRVHLAIVSPRALRADLHQMFAEVKDEGYLILITGPSRTSDIELVVTIGVHGPQRFYVWVLEERD